MKEVILIQEETWGKGLKKVVGLVKKYVKKLNKTHYYVGEYLGIPILRRKDE